MDPNANLRAQRKIATWFTNGGDATTEEWMERANRLAELVEALDEWITAGGFLPDRWEIARKRAGEQQ